MTLLFSRYSAYAIFLSAAPDFLSHQSALHFTQPRPRHPAAEDGLEEQTGPSGSAPPPPDSG